MEVGTLNVAQRVRMWGYVAVPFLKDGILRFERKDCGNYGIAKRLEIVMFGMSRVVEMGGLPRDIYQETINLNWKAEKVNFSLNENWKLDPFPSWNHEPDIKLPSNPTSNTSAKTQPTILILNLSNPFHHFITAFSSSSPFLEKTPQKPQLLPLLLLHCMFSRRNPNLPNIRTSHYGIKSQLKCTCTCICICSNPLPRFDSLQQLSLTRFV